MQCKLQCRSIPNTCIKRNKTAEATPQDAETGPFRTGEEQENNQEAFFRMKNPFLENFRPYIPDSSNLRELTILPLLVGTVLGIIFGASSLYLVLKTGLTVSASIPAVAEVSHCVRRRFTLISIRRSCSMPSMPHPRWLWLLLPRAR